MIFVLGLLDDAKAVMLSNRVAAQLAYVRAIIEDAIPANRVTTPVKADMRYQGLQAVLEHPDDSGLAVDRIMLEVEFVTRDKALVGITFSSIPVELVSMSVTAREKRALDVQVFTQEKADGAVATPQEFDLTAQKEPIY